MKILFASQNKHKLSEVSQLLPESISLIGLQDVAFHDEIEETESTIEGNALLKANFIYEKYNIPTFADDTGLFIEALDGEPGVYSARWSENDDLYSNNIEKALGLLKGKTMRRAYFKTVIAYVDKDVKKIIEGRIDGEISEKVLGEGGFGYDPIFIPEGSTLSFGEMSADDKNKISHRARAMEAFREFLNEYL